MSEYAGICVNIPNFGWMAFVLHLPIVILYLRERVIKWIFDWIFVLEQMFLQVKFVVIVGEQGAGALYLDIPTIKSWTAKYLN